MVVPGLPIIITLEVTEDQGARDTVILVCIAVTAIMMLYLGWRATKNAIRATKAAAETFKAQPMSRSERTLRLVGASLVGLVGLVWVYNSHFG